MEKIKAFLATAKQLLFDKTIFEPEKAATLDAETTIDTCDGIFGTRSENKTDQELSKKAKNKWLSRFSRTHSSTIKNYIDKNK